MRRLVVAGTSLLLIAALSAVLVGTASSASKRPDLAVSDLAEPPQAIAAGSTFRETYTVANQGNRTARRRTTTRFFLDRNPNNSAGRTRVGNQGARGIPGKGEANKRARLRVPAGLATGNYFLVACADISKRLREAREKNNCRVAAQPTAINGSLRGPQGPPGENDETILDRTVLPIGRPTLDGAEPNPNFGDDEKSTQRKELARIGPVSIVADCKRTDNGNGGAPDDPFTSPNSFNEDGDEAKVLIYTDSGTITFNGPGNSSRKNIPPGEGDLAGGDDEPSGYTAANESDGAEGVHTAIAASRDPDQQDPERDWAFAYKVGTIYINHSNGTELVMTAYAGIDVLGVGDNCVFSGVIKRVRVA